MDSHLLKILVCPLCKGPLQHDRTTHTLICNAEKLAFPIKDGVPVMLESAAQTVPPNTPAGDSTAEAPASSVSTPSANE